MTFFLRDGDALVPTEMAHGPWAPDMLHGRLLGGLMAEAIERGHSLEGLRPSRLTVDLFRNARLAPLKVTTDRIRDGRRIRVVDAAVTGPDGLIARASLVLLKHGGHPPGEVWPAERWNVPQPEDCGPPTRRSGGSVPTFDLWRIGAGDDWDLPHRRRAWLRETHPLIGDEPLSPLVRLALAADLASPTAHWSTTGLNYINADYTITLGRLPEGEYIGIEAGGHISADGIAAGSCTLHDRTGPVAFATTTALANRKPG
ncbi:acyl-CoA thioesterase domain-containing protein [Actinocorallia longicatena]|uniref:Thioesterase family protein n=1 Tax=Actinocorallia longicatena TaxID=111803 RepID=A0ABP6QGE9_9ACTN